ncbi:long-chain-fatty-acid--CoA ligase [Nocardia sp. CA-290969]|uniref:long-chain-fatty-acid--CoA ligase n=1 Tax=Nocardia sp. CA-290969 TaxID=3239986 RepID=UPI003D8B4AE7
MSRGMSAGDQLTRHARKIPETPALRFGGISRNYRSLDERVSRLANALRERGVEAGDRVAVLGLNSMEIVEAFLAPMRLGALCVPINFRLTAAEIAYLLADSGAVAAVVDARFAGVLADARTHAPGLRACLVIGTEPGANGDHGDDYETALAAADPVCPAFAVDENSAAYIMYTSGTTGRPKGAVLTHTNLLLHAFSVSLHQGSSGDVDPVALNGAPLFHIAGLSSYLMCLLPGGTFVITASGGFDPRASVELLARERVSSCFFVPAQWQAICALPDIGQYDLSALRQISWGAAPASTTLLRTMIETFPQAAVSTAFGQTECSPVTCTLRGEDALRKIGSVGTPILNVEARIVDDEMNDVAPGAVGEIVYRGPMVMKEYWNKPAETAAAFAGGWFHSGDLVQQDEDGYIYVVDRKKDMIISGGENIYCAEVENVLAAHPGIADVALIGVPHPTWGEAPFAVIVPADPANPPTAEGVEVFARTRLAGYKCPKEIAVVAELPRNPSGKVLKTELRKTHAHGESVIPGA